MEQEAGLSFKQQDPFSLETYFLQRGLTSQSSHNLPEEPQPLGPGAPAQDISHADSNRHFALFPHEGTVY